MARPEPMDLLEAINLFAEHRMLVDEVKDSTITRDVSVLKEFRAIITKGKSPDINIHTVNYDHVTAWRKERSLVRVKGEPLSPNTKNGDIRTIRLFFEWCRDFGPKRRGTSPAAHLKTRRIVEPRHDLLRLPPEEWDALLDAAADEQSRWVIACSLFSFMRDSEVRLATWADIEDKVDQEGNADPGLWITREKARQRNSPPVRDHIYQTLEFQRELARWKKFYIRALAAQGITEIEPHFKLVPAYRPGKATITLQGSDGRFRQYREFKPLSHMTNMEQKVQQALQALGYPIEREGIHFCRRSGALGFFKDLTARQLAGETLEDTPIRIVMALLGHKEQATTEIYLGIKASRLARDSTMKNRAMIEIKHGKPIVVAVEPVAPVVTLPQRHLSVVRHVG